MIKMDKNKTLPRELRFLEETSDFLFILTGSRSFTYGKVFETADWDFFTEEKKGLVDFLEKNGFVNCHNAYENDPLNTAVYRKLLPSLKTHIDIQIVNDLRAKTKLNTALKMYFPYGLPVFSNETDRKLFTKRLWSMMCYIYRS